MFDVFETLSRSRLAYDYGLQSDSPIVNTLTQRVKDDEFNFGLNEFKVYDGRLITQFDDLSVENITLLHIKSQLKRTLGLILFDFFR